MATVWVGSLVATASSADGSKMESSDMMLASKLVIEGDTTWGRTTIGLGTLGGSCSPDLSRCIDLLRAKVGFIVRASESLLSEGRRLLSEGA
jgi:hypothetical protein